MFGMKRIRRRNVDDVDILQVAHRRDAVERLYAELGAVLLARLLSEIRSRDEGESRRLRHRLRQRSSRGAETNEADSNMHRCFLFGQFQPFQSFKTSKPPPLSSPASRGRMKEGVERLERLERFERLLSNTLFLV